MTSRQKRLSGSEGRDIDYSPSDDDWYRIEKAYCHKLDSDTRTEIIALVKEYLLWEGFERNAPFTKDEVKELNCLETLGGAFYRALCFYVGESKHSEAEIYIKDYLKQSRLGDVENLIEIMASSVGAFRYARKKIEEAPRGFVEGPAWDDLIIGLTNVAKVRSLPFKVSKGLDKTSVEEPSDFVRLVRALQDTFPEPSRRHQITYAAAAQAIWVARQRNRKTEDLTGVKSRVDLPPKPVLFD